MLAKLFHLTVVSLIYLGTVVYLFFRVKQAFPKASKCLILLKGVCALLSVLYVGVVFLRIFDFGRWMLPAQLLAYLWMLFVAYAFAVVLLGDALMAVFHFIHPLDVKTRKFVPLMRKSFCILSAVLSCLIVGYGCYHFRSPKIVELSIPVSKPVPDWKIVAVSDLHLGTMDTKLLDQHVRTINELDPDMVLLLGDLFVVNMNDAQDMGFTTSLSQISATKGVYAIFGNHEFFHGFLKAPKSDVDSFFQNMNIRLLRDEVLVVDSQLALVGRLDSSRLYNRRTLDDLAKDLPAGIPSILMDHQPSDLSSAKENGLDLQLSGHTHNGQIFPMNWFQFLKGLLTGKLYYGYRKDADTQYYVTAGLGGSGAPVRIGTSGEIVVIRLKQKAQ